MTLQIGTPPQSIPLLPDTGSGDFSIQSNLIPASGRGNDPVYNPSVSSTSRLISGYTFGECYGSGYCDSGIVYTDTITLGGVTISGIPIQVINSVSTPSSNSQSGNIGMAFGAEQAAVPRGVSDFSRAIRPALAGKIHVSLSLSLK
jgi:aspergillopepsin I